MTDIVDAGTAKPHAAGDWRRKELLAAYVGAAWDDYEKTYQRLLEGGSGLGWSWSLFFFPWMWLIHRKLYLVGIAVWVLDILPRPVGWWIAAATTLAHVVVAAYGKAYFLKRAMAEVETARASAPSDVAAWDRLKDGGIAKGAGFFGVLLPMFVILVLLSGGTHIHLTFTD